jgi:spore coat protein CotH
MRRPFCCLILAAFLLPASATAQTTSDLFSDETLYRIDLLVNSRDWEKLRANFQVNDYYPADLAWRGQTVRNIGIRSRGGGSRSGVKPGLRVDFNRYATGQTFLGLKSVVLDNLTQDPTGLRERVAMLFYQRMGLPAPREAHVQLYVNNTFAGLYAIVESIDKDFLGRVFGGTAGDIENDGYLFDYEWLYEWYFNYLGPDLDAYAALFDPATHENASAFELYAPIEAMVRAINQSSDTAFVSAVAPYLDLRAFVRHVAAQSFVAEWDGILGYAGANNFYLYRLEDSLQSRFIAWDADNAFYAFDYPITAGHDANVLMRRVMQVPELRALYYAVLAEGAALAMEPVPGTGMGWLEWEIARQQDLIAWTMQADPVKPYSNEQFAAGVEGLRTFARERAAFVLASVATTGAAASRRMPVVQQR